MSVPLLLDQIWQILAALWWIPLPFLFFELFWSTRLTFLRARFIKNISWVTLKINVSREIAKTPKAMEQIFLSLHSIYSVGIKPLEVMFDGKVDLWLSFEMVGTNRGAEFYVHFPTQYRNLVESSIYAQYPEAEIAEVPDYTSLLPRILPNNEWDVWGTNIELVRDSYYPIRTYEYFEEVADERRLDTMAAILEVLSGLEDGEKVILQVILSPTGKDVGNKWQEEGVEKIDEIAGRTKAKEKKRGLGDEALLWTRNLLVAPIEPPVWDIGGEKETPKEKRMHVGEQELIKAIGKKIGQPGFETVIRFVYIDKKDSFTPQNVSAVMGTFRQFSYINMFKPGAERVGIGVKGWLGRFSKRYRRWKETRQKRMVYWRYRMRNFGLFNKISPKAEKFSVFTPDELATLYHFPTITVAAPRLHRIPSKKGEPPPELPIG